MKSKYQIDDQLYILHENTIRLCIVNEINIKQSSVGYTVLIEDDKDDIKYISINIDENNIYKSIDDLLKSLKDSFIRTLEKVWYARH